MMRQAQEMQKKIQKIQEEIAATQYTGSSGAGMVEAVIDGSGNVKKISINPSLINKDEKEILEDLIIAALNDAKKKSDEGSAEALRSATAGMPLPPGFKL